MFLFPLEKQELPKHILICVNAGTFSYDEANVWKITLKTK